MNSGAGSHMIKGVVPLSPMSRLAARTILIASLALAAVPVWAGDASAPAPLPVAGPTPPATPAAAQASTTTPAPLKPKPAPLTKAQKAAAKAKAAKNAPITLYHVNRKETMSLRLREANGQPVKGLQKRFNRFLRCHHTNVQHSMNPRLVKLLYQTGKHWPGHRVEVVSGYRSPKVAKNPHSPHMKGLACDFRIEGVKAAELRDYLRRTYEKVGVGYYPNSSFVHLDVRKDRSAFWIDYSGPGERAIYSENPSEDLKSGRADQYHPSKIDESWTDDASKDPPPEEVAKGTPAAPGEPPKDGLNPAQTATP
jgi:uncharacterized protein YcbK (DUF882 family)